MAIPKIIQIPIGDEGALQYHYKRIEISSAEILTTNSVPTVFPIDAPGAGYILLPITSLVSYDFVSVVYGTNTTIGIYYTGGVLPIYDLTQVPGTDIITLGADAISSYNAVPNIPIENATLELREPTGDPTGGDGTLVIYLWYIILKL